MNDMTIDPMSSAEGFRMGANSQNREPLRVLILEDVPTDAELTLRELRKVGIPFVSQRVDAREKFEQALYEFKPDLILSDFSLPASFDGLMALDIARKALPDIPYVFVSGTIGEDRAVEALKQGATDYVLKDRLNRLVPVIQRALDEVEARAARVRLEAELEETRSRLESIVSSLPDVIWSVSPEPYRLLYISPGFKATWGLLAEAVSRDVDAWFEMLHPDDRVDVERAWRAAMRGETFDRSYRIVRGDGEVRWINNRAHAIRDGTGKIMRVDGIARDITRLKVQEDRIVRLSRVRAVLSGINATIVRVKDRDQLFREACRIAVDDGRFALAWIGSLDRTTFELRPGVWKGREGAYLEGMVFSAREDARGGTGTTGLALRTRRAVVVNDVSADPRVIGSADYLARGFRAAIVLPLIVDEEVIGVFKLYAAEANVFDADEVRLLEDVAGNISFALDHIAKSERLDYLAYYDGLTGVPNRKLFHEQLVKLIQSLMPEEQGIAVAVLDLERFRNINETLGMSAGDAVLKQLAERLGNALGEPGTVARISADRFAIALVPMKSATEIAHVLEERIFAALNEPFHVNGEELHIPAKAGIAVHPGDGKDAAALFVNAEAALANAKRSGERYLFYAPQMNARVAAQLKIENELHKAALEEQFTLHYQPRVDLVSGRVCGLEALIRWRHPRRGLVSPGEFIPVLEQTGMILEVGRWALKRAGLDAADWHARGLKTPRIAVNVSQVQLRRKQFVDDVQAALAAAAGHGDRIDIEITESMLMEDIGGNVDKLRAVRQMGINIALDDFGTGYSSLSWLARLPIDSLKIDRSFVMHMAKSPEQMSIVSTVISLAHALNLKVVAEGVETDEQLALLRLLRCDEGQGYVFHRPLPVEQIEALLRSATEER
ncbi:MAG: EAL domain-containing protein [Betaproteobacteria bacterium]|nr:EAL domain-containing protein [Betaproteobacteria bacterium]